LRATATAADYDVILHVVMIPLVLCGPRVAARVAAGGHEVPAEKLASRYGRIWPLVVNATPQCHRAVFDDNAHDAGPVEVASSRLGAPDHPPRWPDGKPAVLRSL
jgi:predicted ABC-type ATPase